MSPVTKELAALLSAVRRPGDFYVSGTAELLAPRLEVEGVGQVALPLLPSQAEQLIAVAERAPYGRGEDTLIDTEVRRSWQIGADRVRIQGKHWARTLEAILARVADGLGVTGPITAEFYKVLLYDPGSFFVSHRDTEKAPGMFATLVLVLPSVSTGGELVVRHKDREVRLNLRCEEPSELAFAAFYADCLHEVLPVAAGCRLTLIYNLVRRAKGPRPEPPSYEAEQGRLRSVLQAWAENKKSPDDESPEKLIYPLEHAYTAAELGFETLKGADAAAAGVLVAAARQSGCDLYLAQLAVEESGMAEYTGGFGSRRRWSGPEEDEFEAGEVTDREVTLSEWRRPDGSNLTLGEIPVLEDELSPPEALDDMDPDEEHFEEATGNEGASFERTYHRAALVLWPSERTFAVLSQAGLPVTLPYLSDLTERWEASGEDRQSPLWLQAHELSAHMLAKWPERERHPGESETPSGSARMLTVLTRLGDTARLDTFLSAVAARSRSSKADNEAILNALGLLPPQRTAALIERMIAGTAATSLSACGDLLARAVAAGGPDRRTELVSAAKALIQALPGDSDRAPRRELWQQPSPGVEPGFVVDLFTALGHIDKTLADHAAVHILAWPKTYGPDTVLIPALRELLGSHAMQAPAAIERLREAGLKRLSARIAEPLEAPKDWSRAATLACRCAHCRELSDYLADPKRKTWIFKAAETKRGHVEGSIRQARCDVEVTTDRQGRPYSLICTKNQASYERRVKQRKKDLADLERLAV